jgi:hypothetical protein
VSISVPWVDLDNTKGINIILEKSIATMVAYRTLFLCTLKEKNNLFMINVHT